MLPLLNKVDLFIRKEIEKKKIGASMKPCSDWCWCPFLTLHAVPVSWNGSQNFARGVDVYRSLFPDWTLRYECEFEIEYEYDFPISNQLGSQGPRFSLLLTRLRRGSGNEIGVTCANLKHAH